MMTHRLPKHGLSRHWRIARALAVGLLALGVAAPASQANDDDVINIQFLSNTGEIPAAKAKARLRFKEDSTDFKVELEQIADGTYSLFVADDMKGDIEVAGSVGEIEFETPLDEPKPLLDFDVLGQTIEIRQGETVLFSAVFAGDGAGGGGGSGKVKVEVFMVNVGPDANAKSRLRYEAKSNKLRFKVKVEQLAAGDNIFQFFVGGTQRAEFDTTGLNEVELDFRDPVSDDDDDDGADDGEATFHLPLDFAPLGKAVEVRQGLQVFLSALMPGPGATKPPKKGGKAAKNIGKKKGDRLRVKLLDLGVIDGPSGKLELGQSATETEFRVELEDLPDSSYMLRVGGVDIAPIVVVGGEGRLDFSTTPEGDELLLDFAVKAQLIEILLDTDAVLGTVFPVSVQAALGKFKKEKVKENKIRLNLINTGLDLDATGFVTWKRNKKGVERLKLRTRDLPAGDYTLRVDGIARGVFTVKKQDGPGKLKFKVLEFDVVGLLLEIVDSEDAVPLSVVLGGVI